MANFIEVQSALAVQFNADTNLVTTPITLVCNRQYEVADYSINVITSNGNQAPAAFATTRITIDSYTAAGVLVTALGTVNSTTAPTDTAGTWQRPAVSAIAILGAAVTNALIGSAAVARGDVLRISASAGLAGAGTPSLVRAQGTLRIFAGNRYSAVTLPAAYYANNSASGNSSASVAI